MKDSLRLILHIWFGFSYNSFQKNPLYINGFKIVLAYDFGFSSSFSKRAAETSSQ